MLIMEGEAFASFSSFSIAMNDANTATGITGSVQ